MNQGSIKTAQQGVVLIEAMISIVLFSIGVLAIVGLQASMVKHTSESKFRMDAGYIAQQRVGAMWADPSNLATYLEANTDISSLLPNGRRTTTQAGDQYTVTITWQQPGEAQHTFSTTATIVGG